MESEGFARTEENRIEDIRCIIRHDDYFENRYHGLIYIKLHREFVRINEIEGSNYSKAI